MGYRLQIVGLNLAFQAIFDRIGYPTGNSEDTDGGFSAGKKTIEVVKTSGLTSHASRAKPNFWILDSQLVEISNWYQNWIVQVRHRE